MDFSQFHHFKDREECNDNMHLGVLLLEELAETESFVVFHIAVDICEFIRESDLLFFNLSEFTPDRVDLVSLALHDLLKDCT